MLPAEHRLRDSESFRLAGRRGQRRRAGTMVTQLWERDDDAPARVGLIVGKAVGDAVIRNRVKRRLRHLVRDHLDRLPRGSVLVVRALPAAGRAPAATLGADLARCLDLPVRR